MSAMGGKYYLTSSFSVCVCTKSLQLCLTLCDPMDCRFPVSSVHWILQSRKRVGCHVSLQGIFPTQGSNLHLPHLKQIFLCWATGKEHYLSCLHVFSWPKSSSRSFCNILWKNPKEHFGQHNIVIFFPLSSYCTGQRLWKYWTEMVGVEILTLFLLIQGK